MRTRSLIAMLCLLPVTAAAQNIFPYRDLAFAQIAAGGGYETVLNAANRGSTQYEGTLTLIPTDASKPFPLLVNGNPLTGPLNLTVDPGATVSLRITSGNASAGTLTGFAVVRDSDLNQNALLEGNLTYYVKTPDGTIVDSVGVAPSNSIVQTVIPFDDFLTVALALANQNAGNHPATLTIKIFDDKNALAGTATQTLANNQQVAKFLYQYFPGVTLTKGRVEIQSSRQIMGTALTFVSGNQASALPFLPSMKVYNYAISVAGQTFTGKMSVALAGPFLSVYAVDETGGKAPSGFEQASGVLEGGNLEIYVRANRGTTNDLLFFGEIGFDPLQSSLSGPMIVYFVNPPGAAGQGTVTLTAVN